MRVRERDSVCGMCVCLGEVHTTFINFFLQSLHLNLDLPDDPVVKNLPAKEGPKKEMQEARGTDCYRRHLCGDGVGSVS